MEIRLNTEKQFLIFYLEGNIDIVRASKLEKEIDRLISLFPNFHILFSLKTAGLISSSGFGMIINFQRKKSREGVRVAVSNLSKDNRKIIDLMGVEGMIEIYSQESDFESKCGSPF